MRHTHTQHTHSHYTQHTHRTPSKSQHCQDPKDGELCLISEHFRGVSWRYRRANRSLHSAQQLVLSEVSLRVAGFEQFSSGAAND